MSIRQRARGAITYPGRYKDLLLEAVQSIDLDKVSQAIELFKSTRVRGRRIFVCGNSGTESLASEFLCDLVKRATFNRSSRFRILALSDQATKLDPQPDDIPRDRIFVEQLKNFAEPEDVVMGICVSGNSPNVVNAIEYASWIGCRTIVIAGGDGGRASQLAELNIEVPVTHIGSIKDVQMIICHMIGYYFADGEEH